MKGNVAPKTTLDFLLQFIMKRAMQIFGATTKEKS